MKPGQKSVGSNGLQNSLFPLDVMYISQGQNEGFSHSGVKAVDYQHITKSGIKTKEAWYYAPADVTCIQIGSGKAGLMWATDNEVNTPIGKTRLVYMVWHDNHVSEYKVGDKRKQGEKLGRTGVAGFATGDHVHIEINTGGTFDKSKAIDNWNAFYVNDTEMNNTHNYAWKTTDDSTGSINGSCDLNTAGDGTWALNEKVNDKVKSYEPMMKAECERQGIPEATVPLLALMMTESEGYGGDPMQSSESQGWAPNTIKDPAQSIYYGVKHFKEASQKSAQYKVDIWTTFQEYNFGIGYSKYIGERGGINTIELAEWYSMNKVSPHQPPIKTSYSWEGAKAVGKPYRWLDGGNFHYANRVKWYVTGDGSINACGNETGVTDEKKNKNKILDLLMCDALNGWKW